MPTDQYHEPPAELSDETRTFARMCASLSEEAEAIGWYEQRIAVEKNEVAKAIMQDSLAEEYKHFSMELEFLLRAKPQWRETLRGAKSSPNRPRDALFAPLSRDSRACQRSAAPASADARASGAFDVTPGSSGSTTSSHSG
jgi:hypothetical protein